MNQKSVLSHIDSIDFTDTDELIESFNLKKTRCDCFVYKLSKDGTDLCFCGLPLHLHHESVRRAFTHKAENYPVEWNYERHTTADEPTDAFGELKFETSKRNDPKYLRVDFRTPLDQMVKIIFEVWKMHRPKLIISITGGAKNFKINAGIKNALKRAVISAALSTDAWLVTGGTNEGIMKIIGEAFKESAIRLKNRRKLILLGIANWTTIKNNHLLTRKSTKPNMYSHDEEHFKNHPLKEFLDMQKGAYLDPNHTHFILVDNAHLNNYGGELKFRAELLDLITDPKSINVNEIPMVMLVIGGGPNTLKLCEDSCRQGTPCLFLDIQGSEGASNILSFVYRFIEDKLSKENKENENSDELLTDANILNEILHRCKQVWGQNKSDMDIEKMVDTIRKIFVRSHFHLLASFSIDSSKPNIELDEAILHSLLKAVKNSREYRDKKPDEQDEQNFLVQQLDLALNWNRIDVAKKYILENDQLKASLLKNAMYKAINEDRPDFVDEFLDFGLKLRNFLTYRLLLKLYNDIPNVSAFFNTYFHKKFSKYSTWISGKGKQVYMDEIFIRFKDVGLVLKYLFDNFYRNEYLKHPYESLTTLDSRRIIEQTDKFGQKEENIELNVFCFRHRSIEIDDFCDKPDVHLFIYAVLAKKPKLAKVFLKEGRNQLIGCLFATKIFKSYAEHEESDRAEYEELAGEFEGIAIRLINKFYQDNPAASFLLLTRTIPEYGNNTCLQIAHLANDKNFISQRCVQELLERLWYGNLSKEFGFFKMAISLAMPFVVPFEFFYRGRVNKNYFKEINGQEKVAENKCEEKNFVINRIDINNLKEPKDYLSRLYNFFQAPIVKFLYDKIIYMFFLTLFCYVILCDFYAIESAQQSPTSHSLNISAIEIVLIIWVFSFLIERIHYFYVIESKIFWTKCKLFILNLLNAMYAIAIILFIVGIALRFIPNRPDCHKASRIILSLDVIFWFLNFLHVYTSVKVMGPKLIMMMKMVYELIYFIFIVLAFLMAFGISYHALNYHNIRPSLDLVKNFFLPSFFIIPQEYYTVDSLLEADTCEVNKTDRVLTDEYSLDDCVDKEGSQVALALYTIYTVFISVLMVNLLIAIFSNTIDEIQKESDKVWKFQRYSLIYEYFHKPILIPPLVVFYPLGYIIKYLAPLVRRCWQPEHDSTKLIDRLMVKFFYRFRNGFKSNLADARLERRLVDWENKMFHQYLTDQNLEEHRRIEQRLQENLDKYDFLIQKFDSILVHTNTAYSKIREINDKIENIYIQKYVQTKKNL